MPVLVNCPHCHQPLNVPEACFNTNVTCSRCQQVLFVAAPAGSQAIATIPGVAAGGMSPAITKSPKLLPLVISIVAMTSIVIIASIAFIFLSKPSVPKIVVKNEPSAADESLKKAEEILIKELASGDTEEANLEKNVNNLTAESDRLRAELEASKREQETLSREHQALIGEEP